MEIDLLQQQQQFFSQGISLADDVHCVVFCIKKIFFAVNVPILAEFAPFDGSGGGDGGNDDDTGKESIWSCIWKVPNKSIL